jgi:asparagine synthase (glutamine-hydrolysing)
VRLGHRRLSIIDLSDAASCSSRTGWCWCVCGEIDSYRELKAELGAAGTGFRTDSDTEVLLEAWRRWGPGSLRRLRGMFAFALNDERQGTLTWPVTTSASSRSSGWRPAAPRLRLRAEGAAAAAG